MVETASCYPTEEQHERWKQRAEDLGMTKSDFIASMVEAGIKATDGFEPGVGEDETTPEIRRQRNELKNELAAARDRVSELEGRVYGAERKAAREFVRDNPGCSHSELINHLQSTVPGRMSRITEGLVIDETPDGDEGWYVPGDEGQGDGGGEATYISELGVPVRGDY